MAMPPWTFELLRRGLTDAAKRASDPETLAKLKHQASELMQDFPETAARGIDRVMRSAEASKDNVQKWARKHTALALPMLNASGTLLNEFGSGVPLADGILEAGQEVLRGDVLSGTLAQQRINKRLDRLSVVLDGRAIAIASSFSAAISSITLSAGDRQLVVHRSQAVRLDGHTPLPEAFGSLLPVVHEVGAVDEVRLSDFDSLDSFCCISADAGTGNVRAIDFGDRDAKQVVVLPVGSVYPIKETTLPSAQALLDDGIDLVVIPGDGIIGGPQCGVVIGTTEMVGHITESDSWPSLCASDAIAAMTSVALELHASTEESPVESLISTSEENLRGRAERLATRLSGSENIGSTQVTDVPARFSASGQWQLPSRQIAIKHNTVSAADLQERLRESLPAI